MKYTKILNTELGLAQVIKIIFLLMAFFLVSCEESRYVMGGGELKVYCESDDKCVGDLICVDNRCVDLCAGVGCNGHGECVLGEGEGLGDDGRVDASPVPRCECDDGYQESGLNCIKPDFDLCDGVSCGEHGECVVIDDLPARAGCECDSGYEDDGRLNCIDINECKINNGGCGGRYDCINNEGREVSCVMLPFVTTWDTEKEGLTSNTQIKIPINPEYIYHYSIDCNNDGILEAENVNYSYTCKYEFPGEYRIAIRGLFPAIYFNDEGDKGKIISIEQWGGIKWRSMRNAFRGCSNLYKDRSTDIPILSDVTDMSYMFSKATIFNSSLSKWNVSTITNMKRMFQEASSFNGDLSLWDVSNVIDMEDMFDSASSFNGHYYSISSWDVSNVNNMSGMFMLSGFMGDLSNWDVSNVTDMSWMFFLLKLGTIYGIENWNVSNVTNMSSMFKALSDFDIDLSSWDVNQVDNCEDFDTNTPAWILPKPNFTQCTP